MKEMILMDKYPVVSLEIKKTDTSYRNVDEVLIYLKALIDAHPIATYIGEFDHYSHTKSLEVGKVSEDIIDAKNIICCFGKILPKPELLAIRPRAIGVAQMVDSFVVSFMEAPNAEAHATMVKWVEGIKNT